ncbi:hypothetical protein MMB232_00133 [Brevundimonas subvibrioides]|uniref:Uncharacterized protein n=2 Tax=Brevundimonas subvibrioides TaxID=74313 RepID=D9QIX5_BRESC|nr:conserved hypothetical protein [Brevundimonas subvibrioides ATCC 15264]
MEPVSMLVASMLLGGMVEAPDGCAPHPHYDGELCPCTREATFYGPWTPGSPWPHGAPGGGYGPPIYIPAGPDIHVRSPGARVYGRPIEVAGPVVYISGPPVYVEAPPIRVAPAQIYVQRPEVHVNPSQILVEPPQVHFSDCTDGTVCTPVTPGGH